MSGLALFTGDNPEAFHPEVIFLPVKVLSLAF
jgi:hypothetical protein